MTLYETDFHCLKTAARDNALDRAFTGMFQYTSGNARLKIKETLQ
jgi:hypothetical protein